MTVVLRRIDDSAIEELLGAVAETAEVTEVEDVDSGAELVSNTPRGEVSKAGDSDIDEIDSIVTSTE